MSKASVLSRFLPAGLAALVSLGIAACDSSGTGEPTAAQAPADEWPTGRWYAARPHVLRALPDAERGRVWALRPGGLDLYDARTSEKLRTIRLPGWTWVGEAYACSPGLAVAPGGDVLVTSNVLPVIWRVDAMSFEVTGHELAVADHGGKDIGFSGLTWLAQRSAFFAVSGLDGSLWRIDPSLTRAQPVPLSAVMPRACGVTAKSAALCVQTELGEWKVDLAPDERSGSVRPAQCAER